MASTNHTQNYALSQFAATDKPAWLGDYNQDMNKIDAGMKDNADDIATVNTTVGAHTTAISGLTSDVAAAQADVDAIDGRVSTLETSQGTQDTAIATAQTTADRAEGKADTNTSTIAQQALDINSLQLDTQANATAIAGNTSSISAVNTALDAFKTSLTITKFDTITTLSGVDTNYVNLTLAQSADSATFKFYGTLSISHGSGAYTVAKTAVKDLTGVYGFKLPLKLDYAPSESMIIDGAGLDFAFVPGQESSNGVYYAGRQTRAFAVDTDGYIYACADTSSTFSVPSNERHAYNYMACVYFNTNFGDQSQPQS